MCDERERLIGYVYDECDAGERRLIEAHLGTCETCREEIGGLRGVRTDLLAWDVPDHGSVWTPFVNARPEPWWREVPAWAMAAAATLTFLVGAAGGVATQALLSPAQATAGVGQAELAALEQRIRAGVRSDVDARVQLVSIHQAPASPVNEEQLMRRVSGLIRQSEQRQFLNVKDISNDLVRAKRSMDQELADLRQLVSLQPGK